MTNFDVTKYVGTWYEAASIPKGYESGCTEAVAFYSLDGDNLGVTNFCIDNGYLISRIDGTATTDKAFNTDSKLTVTFHNREGSYWIYFTDYISCSIVGGDSDDSLWLLVRKKPLADHLRRRMIALCDVFSLPSEYLVWKM